jgi:hypothetical protein
MKVGNLVRFVSGAPYAGRGLVVEVWDASYPWGPKNLGRRMTILWDDGQESTHITSEELQDFEVIS